MVMVYAMESEGTAENVPQTVQDASETQETAKDTSGAQKPQERPLEPEVVDDAAVETDVSTFYPGEEVEIVPGDDGFKDGVKTEAKAEDKPKRPFTGKSGVDDEQLLLEIRKCGGFLSNVARKLGVSLPAISKRVNKNPKLREEVDTINGIWVDLAQNELFKKVREGDRASIFFILKCKGGYIEKHKFELDGGDMPTPLTFVLPTAAAIQAARDAKTAIAEAAGR